MYVFGDKTLVCFEELEEESGPKQKQSKRTIRSANLKGYQIEQSTPQRVYDSQEHEMCRRSQSNLQRFQV